MAQQPPSVVVYTQPGGFSENDPRHRCKCCCCSCCHIRTAAIIFLILELVGCVYNLGTYGSKLGILTDPGAITFVVFFNMIVPIVLVVAIILCFVAIFAVKSVLVWPHIIALAVILVAILIQFVVFIITLVGVDTGSLKGILAKNEEDEKAYKKTLSELNVSENDINAMAGGALAVLCLIQVLFYIWCIILFLHLKRYLAEKQAAMQSGGTEMGKMA